MLDDKPPGFDWLQAPAAYDGPHGWRGVKYLVLAD